MLKSILTAVTLVAGTVAVAELPDTADNDRAALLRQLYSKHFLAIGNCVEVSNQMLFNIGLPLADQTEPVKGVRGTMDRSHMHDPLPVFKDELIDPFNGFKVSVRSEAQPSKKQWLLKVVRTPTAKSVKGDVAKRSSETTLTFDVVGPSNNQSCEFKAMTFRSPFVSTPQTKLGEWIKFGLDECLNTYIDDTDSILKDKKAEVRQSFNWMKKDCALAIRYSGEAKARIRNWPMPIGSPAIRSLASTPDNK